MAIACLNAEKFASVVYGAHRPPATTRHIWKRGSRWLTMRKGDVKEAGGE